MDPMEINDEKSLAAWLSDKPAEWAQAIALRAALRALPYIGVSRDSWLEEFALLPFGAVMTSWIQLTESSINIFKSNSRANARFGGHSFDFLAYKEARVAAWAADASYHSADAQTQSVHVIRDCVEAVTKAAEAFRNVAEARADWGENEDLAEEKIWFSVQLDCLRLSNDNSLSSAHNLAVSPLWSSSEREWHSDWERLSERLRAIDPNYAVWIGWYRRRIYGARGAFQIRGTRNTGEDIHILRRLAEARDEDFWSKGHEYVNATLTGWLDEARARAAPPQGVSEPENRPFIEIPGPVSGATAFGLNSEGKLDRLPHYDQQHLRDLPNQRRAYIDVRLAALELQEEGQRLGPKLTPRIDRFVSAFPKRFEDAEAWPIWSAAAALRTLYWKHKAVADSPDPDDAKLEPGIAIELRGFLDLQCFRLWRRRATPER